MTHAQRNAAIAAEIEAYTARNTLTKKAAQAALVRGGFYLNEYDPAPEFDTGDRGTKTRT